QVFRDEAWHQMTAEWPDVVVVLLEADSLTIDDVTANCSVLWGAAPEELRQRRFANFLEPSSVVDILQSLRHLSESDETHVLLPAFRMMVRSGDLVSMHGYGERLPRYGGSATDMAPSLVLLHLSSGPHRRTADAGAAQEGSPAVLA